MKPSDLAGPPRSFSPAEYESRLRATIKNLRNTGLDGVFLTGAMTRLYLTGFESSNGLLLVDVRKGPVFLTDARYLLMARKQVRFMPCHLLKRAPVAQRQLASLTRGWRRVGYEGSLPAIRLSRWREELPHAAEWTDFEPSLQKQRAVKSPRERAALRRAMAANDRLLAAVLRQVSTGMSEWEIRHLVRREADRLGQGTAFDCIPCVGANAAEPHHQPGLDCLRANQALLLDLGLKLDHYCADLTRTVCLGRPGRLLREIHRVVLTANRRAIAQIRPGMTGEEADDVARRLINRAGYGRFFTHGLGHALGLEVHESPSLAPGCREKLVPGMVLTVEPGIYLPGRVGVRIEDVVEITRTGCAVLSQSPRELER